MPPCSRSSAPPPSAAGRRSATARARPCCASAATPDAPWVWTVGPRHAHLERFDLHADRDVRADDRLGLERLCRYLLRPPLAQERLTRLADGRVLCTLARPWHDGTRHLIFTPHEFLERLAAITPRPHINLVLYHGVLAPRARWRPPGSFDPAVVAPPSTARGAASDIWAGGPADCGVRGTIAGAGASGIRAGGPTERRAPNPGAAGIRAGASRLGVGRPDAARVRPHNQSHSAPRSCHRQSGSPIRSIRSAGRSSRSSNGVHNWGEDRVFYRDRAGHLTSLPARWTSVVPEDPFVVVAAGRARLRVDDLRELAALVRRRGRIEGRKGGAGGGDAV